MNRYMRSVRTILVPQRSPNEPYTLMLDSSETSSTTQGVLNNNLVDQINQELYDIAIIKNSRLLDDYKKTIQYLVEQKKKDIQEVHDYIKKRDGEVADFKIQIEELTKELELYKAKLLILENEAKKAKPIEETTEPIEETTESVEETVEEEQVIESAPASVSDEVVAEEVIPEESDLDCSIEQLLRKQLTRAKIEYTLEVISTTKPFALMLTVNDTRIMIEITSNSKKTNEPTINAFKARVNDSAAHHGLFVAMENEYTAKSGITDFSIEHLDSKYILYIANVESGHYRFKNAINILLQFPKKETTV